MPTGQALVGSVVYYIAVDLKRTYLESNDCLNVLFVASELTRDSSGFFRKSYCFPEDTPRLLLCPTTESRAVPRRHTKTAKFRNLKSTPAIKIIPTSNLLETKRDHHAGDRSI